MSLKTYDPDQVVIYFSGILIEGYADGEFITVEQMTPAFTSVVGSNGEVARSKSNDNRTKVTVKLLQTSSSNPLLSAIHLVDLNSTNGAGVGTFLMQDLEGATIVTGAQTWITQFPDTKMDRGAVSREWSFEIASSVRLEGGN